MIIIGLLIVTTVLGFILMKSDIYDTTYIVGWAMRAFGFAFLIFSCILIIVAHATANNIIQQNKIEYEGLCKRYEIIKSDYEDVSKSDVINDITEWNMKVYNTKYWSENPLTNIFNSQKIADNLEYISLDE